jgi:DNA polymerase elongation subunit (family B)
MLRNIFYDRKRSIIHHWIYDEQGESIHRKVQFKPYLYIPSVSAKENDAIGIDDKPLTKREFVSEWERNNFIKSYRGQLYFNLPPTQQYLLDNYYNYDITQLTSQPLRTFFYDIEVVADEFPDPKDAKFPITSITIFDTKTQKYYVWGVKYYDSYSCKDHLKGIEPEEIVYQYCASESDLLKRFIRFWRANFPDLLVGYNSYSFDLPYIIHRIDQVFEKGKGALLSPVDYIYGYEKENKFSQTYIEYTLGGISHLDYMVLYKTFTPGERESDSLDYVSKEELGSGKLDYGDTSLQDLAVKDWNRFINYNIWDVKLLMLIDEKRKYLDIARFSAFSGFCNVDKALGKVAVIGGIIAKQGLLNNKIITTQTEGVHEHIPGGYVKDIDNPGLYENIMVMDLNSLYPNIIITLNISPETKVGKIIKKENGIFTVDFCKAKKIIDVPEDKFTELLKSKGWALSSSDVIFSQDKKGLCAEFVDTLYQKRKKVKTEMFAYENKIALISDKDSPEYIKINKIISQLDTEQYLYKILLNSTYGVLANRFFVLYDIDCAKSVTLTGQKLIKQSEKIVNDYMQKQWDLPICDRVTAIDTDSVIISINDILIKENTKIVDDNGDLTPEFVKIETLISDNLNSGVNMWAKEALNTKDCRFEFKRESVCPKAIWVAKKHYVMHIKNSEGVKMDKFKYKGLSVVKSSFPEKAKAVTKSIVRGIFESPDKIVADKFFFKSYETFLDFVPSDVATRSSIKVLSKWESSANGTERILGCPRHVQCAIYYNHLVKSLNLDSKYPLIESGSKVKLVYVKPNKYNIEGIAFPDHLPEEFELEVDNEIMFDKCVTKCLEPIFSALKWNVPNPKKQPEISLDDLFS